MRKRMPNRAQHFVGDPRQLSNALTATTREKSRLAAIRECLRDLQGADLIYAIRLPDGIIKIGHTQHIIERRAHLNTTPEALLAIQPGTFEDEQQLHHELQGSVARAREYYHATPEVLAYINGVRETMGVSPIAA